MNIIPKIRVLQRVDRCSFVWVGPYLLWLNRAMQLGPESRVFHPFPTKKTEGIYGMDEAV